MLSIEQRNAIDLLITGQTDAEVAAAVGVSRQAVWGWRTSHLVFQRELEQARANLWRRSAERLRGMLTTALDNIAAQLARGERGDVKWSYELLKAVGIYGDVETINHVKNPDMWALIKQEAERRIRVEGIPKSRVDIIGEHFLADNSTYSWRMEEILDELQQAYENPAFRAELTARLERITEQEREAEREAAEEERAVAEESRQTSPPPTVIPAPPVAPIQAAPPPPMDPERMARALRDDPTLLKEVLGRLGFEVEADDIPEPSPRGPGRTKV